MTVVARILIVLLAAAAGRHYLSPRPTSFVDQAYQQMTAGEFERAIQALQRWRSAKAEFYRGVVRQRQAAAARKRSDFTLETAALAAAEKHYNEYLRHFPDATEALNNLAHVEFDRDKRDRAFALLEHAIEVARRSRVPADLAFYERNLADLHRRAGDTTAAVPFYEESVKDDPENVSATRALLRAYAPGSEGLRQRLRSLPKASPLVAIRSVGAALDQPSPFSDDAMIAFARAAASVLPLKGAETVVEELDRLPHATPVAARADLRALLTGNEAADMQWWSEDSLRREAYGEILLALAQHEMEDLAFAKASRLAARAATLASDDDPAPSATLIEIALADRNVDAVDESMRALAQRRPALDFPRTRAAYRLHRAAGVAYATEQRWGDPENHFAARFHLERALDIGSQTGGVDDGIAELLEKARRHSESTSPESQPLKLGDSPAPPPRTQPPTSQPPKSQPPQSEPLSVSNSEPPRPAPEGELPSARHVAAPIHRTYLFDLESDYLPCEAVEPLVEILANKRSTIRIDGYTDSTGSAGYNMQLSGKRAARVRKCLLKYHIHPDRITTKPHGEADPAFNNSTRRNRERNRRAECTVSPPE